MSHLACFALFVSGAVVDLDVNNWDELVVASGKNAFVKFYAPWCGHCKKLKPDWDRLGNAHDADSHVLIGDVDCTSDVGKPLCERHNVRGFPTLKHIYGTMVDDYKGGRIFEEIRDYAAGLKPLCSPAAYENCSAEQLELMKSLEAMEDVARHTRLTTLETELKTKEDDLKALLDRVKKEYETASADVEAAKSARAFEMSLLRAMASSKPKDEL